MSADQPLYRTHEADSPYHRTLPIGERLDSTSLVEDPLSCFDSVVLKALEPMLVPEEPRHAVGAGWTRVAESLASGGGTAYPNGGQAGQVSG